MKNTVLFLHGPLGRTSRLLLEGFTAFALEKGWSVQRLTPPDHPPADYLQRLIGFWNPIGIVADCGPTPEMPRASSRIALPVVYIDGDIPREKPKKHSKASASRLPPRAFVSIDSPSIARQAARLLLESDCATYAYVSTYRRTHWCAQRQEAFREAVELNGGRFFHFDGRGLSPDDNASIDRLGTWLASLPKPCGLLAANDRMASMVLAAAAFHNVAVPDELNVVGIDNDETICETSSPPLSSIEADFYEGGWKSGERLAALLTGKRSGEEHYGSTRIVHRLSTRRLLRSTPLIRTVLEHIRRHATDGISATDVLPLLGGSRRSAEKHFRSATGKSILAEILDVRFERLFSLLNRGVRTPDALVDLTGFSSINHLRRQFKARYGTSITRYCREHDITPREAKTAATRARVKAR